MNGWCVSSGMHTTVWETSWKQALRLCSQLSIVIIVWLLLVHKPCSFDMNHLTCFDSEIFFWITDFTSQGFSFHLRCCSSVQTNVQQLGTLTHTCVHICCLNCLNSEFGILYVVLICFVFGMIQNGQVFDCKERAHNSSGMHYKVSTSVNQCHRTRWTTCEKNKNSLK